MGTRSTSAKRSFFLFGLMFSVTQLVLGQTTYYSRATGDWNNVNTWSTVSHAGAPATSVPNGATDIVLIGSGHTVTLNTSPTVQSLTVNDDATSGILRFPFTGAAGYAANYTLTVGTFVTVNASGQMIPIHGGEGGFPGTNTARTHNLLVGTNLTNNGTIDLEGTATNRRIILNLNGSSNATVTGSGTYDFGTTAGNLTFSKTSATVVIENQSTTFNPAGFLTWTGGRYYHNNSGTFSAFAQNANFTLTNGSLQVDQGTVNLYFGNRNADYRVTFGGDVTINGGTVIIGDDLGGADVGDLTVNGTFTMTGGTIQAGASAPPTVVTDGEIWLVGTATISGGTFSTDLLRVENTVTFSGGSTTFLARQVDVRTTGNLTFSQLTANIGASGTDGNVILRGAGVAPRGTLTVNNGATINLFSTANNAFQVQQSSSFTINNATVNLAPNAVNNNDALQILSGTDASNMTSISISNGGVLNVGTGTFGDWEDDGTSNFTSVSVDGGSSSFTVNGNGGTVILRNFAVTNGASANLANLLTVNNTFTMSGAASFTLGTSTAIRTLTTNGTVTITGTPTFAVGNWTVGQDGAVSIGGGTFTINYPSSNTGTLFLTGEASALGATFTMTGGALTLHGHGDGTTFEIREGAVLTMSGGASITVGASIANNNDILRIQRSLNASFPTTISISGGADLVVGTGTFGDVVNLTSFDNINISVSGAGSTFYGYGNGGTLTVRSLSITSGGAVIFGGSTTVETTFTLTGTGSSLSVGQNNYTRTFRVNGTGTIGPVGNSPSLYADRLIVGLDGNVSAVGAATITIGDNTNNLGRVQLVADPGGPGGQLSLANTVNMTVYSSEDVNSFLMQQNSRLTLSNTAQLTVAPNVTTNIQAFVMQNGTVGDSTKLAISGGADLVIGNSVGNFGRLDDNGAGGAMIVITLTGSGSTMNAYGTAGTMNMGRLAVSSSGLFNINNNLTIQNRASFTSSAQVTIGDDVTGTLTTNGPVTVTGASTLVVIEGLWNLNSSASVTAGTLRIAQNMITANATRLNIGTAGSLSVNTNGLISVIQSATSVTGGNIAQIAGNVTVDGGTLRIAENVTSFTGGNIWNQTNASIVSLLNGTIEIGANAGLTTVTGGGNAYNMAGTSSLIVGDGDLGESATLTICPNLVEQLPLTTPVAILDIAGTSASMTMETDAVVQIGAANRGNLRLIGGVGLTNSVVVNGGTLNITATLAMGSGSSFTLNNGTVNVGTNLSDGTNTITFPGDAVGPTQLTVNNGTLTVGDGNSSITMGDGDNNPTISSGDYVGFEINGGTVVVNGRIDMNDRAARFVQTGGSLTINPQGDQDIGGNNNVFRMYRGAARFTGGTLTILNPNPNAGGNGTTSGFALLVQPLGNGNTTDAVLHDGTGSGIISTFTGSTIRFGDGTASAAGSVDGFDCLLATSFTYSNIVINNPSGDNRHVTFATTPNNGTLTITNFTITAGTAQLGTAATPTSPNVLVTGTGNFVLGTDATIRIGNTTNSAVPASHPVNFPYNYASYSIGANSTIEYSGAGSARVGLPNGSGQNIANLIISGSGTKEITSTHNQTLTGTMRLSGSTLNVGAQLILDDGATVTRAGTDAAGIIGTGTLQQTNAAHVYTIRYEGNAKTMQNGEWVTGGTPGLRNLYIDMTAGQTVLLNTSRTVRDLNLNSGNFNANGNVLSVNRHITGSSNGQQIGTGSISITGGSATHQISGTLNFQNVTMNDASHNAQLQSGAVVNIAGVFTLTAGILEAGDQAVNFALASSIGGSPSASAMITTGGTLSQAGVTKTLQAGTSFTYPIGVGSKYTPATVTITAAFGSGPVTIKPITGGEHPVTQDPQNLALNYYWNVGFTGMTGVSDVSLSFVYDTADLGVDGTETLYVPARYRPGANPWSIAGTTAAVQENTPSAGKGTINFNNVNYLFGDFTAGEAAEFNNATVLNYYSLGGNWSVPSSWSTDGYGGAPAVTLPAANSPVFIGNGATIVVDAGGATAVPSISLESTGILDIQVTPVTSFGAVSGTGTMRLHTGTFPTGTFTSFLSSAGGTVEYRGTGSYSIPASPTAYNNLTFAGSGTTKTLPNADLAISGNMLVNDNVTVLLSNGASGNLTITGNLTVTGSSSILRYQNGTARSVTVNGSVTVSSGATFEVANSAAVNNTLSIGSNTASSGNLTVTNGTFRMLNGTGIVNVTFAGNQNATLSVPAGGTPDPVVIFNRLIVNKGTTQAPELNVNVLNTSTNAFRINGPTNTASKALELVNGTFRISNSNVNGTVDGQNFAINLSTGGGDFTIPATAGLRVSGGAPIVLSDSGGDDITLNGALTIDGTGQMYVGTVTSGLVANSIKYSSTSASLTVGGSAVLTVGTGIRANGTASLNYNQSGGTVTVGRYTRETGEPTFELTNTSGGQFTMSGGTIIVVRGGTNDSESTQILTTTNNVTGGTFQITNANTPTGNHRVRLNSPVWNLSLPFASYNGQIDFNTYDVVVLNDFTMNLGGTGSVYFQNNIDLRVDGTFTLTSGTITGTNLARTLDVNNFVQNGGTFSMLGTSVNSSLEISGNFTKTAGTFNVPATTGTVTFDGASTPQTVSSNTGLTFNNLTINNSATSGVVQLVNCDLTINGNWTTTLGDLDAQTNSRTVTFASSTAAQTITGNTTFYNLTINNTFTTNTVTLTSGTIYIRSDRGSGGTITFTNGILNLGNNGLEIRNTDASAISGATSARFIRVSGSATALGVIKHYPSGASDFTFPVGTASDYTPARINATASGSSSNHYTRVRAVNAIHPLATTSAALNYYWDVDGFNWSGSFSFNNEFTYVESKVHSGGNDNIYIGARYAPTSWTTLGDIVDETTNVITFNGTTVASSDFTAGEGSAFGAVVTYYSWGPNGTIGNSFNWGVPTNNTATSPWSGAASSFVDISSYGAPSSASPVIIQRNHTVTITTNSISVGSLTFDNTNGDVALVLGTTTGHNFGTVDGAGIIRLETGTLPGGTYTDFNADGGVFEFTGAGSFNIPAGTYRNLIVSGAGTKTAAGTLTIQGDLTIAAGATLDLGTQTANRSSVGGTMTMGATSTLLLAGANNFPANYSTYTLNATSTVDYNGNIAQTIAARTYGNLTSTTNGTVTKGLNGSTVVQGNLTLTRTGGNPTFATNNHALSIGGNLAINQTQVIWSSGTSTITFNGTAAQSITRTGGGALTFQGLTINNASGVSVTTSTAATNLTVNGVLTLTNGAFAIGGSGGVANSLTLAGTVSTAAGTLTGGTVSDLTINGTGAAGTINFTSGGQALRNFTMNRTSSGSVTIGTPLTIGTATTGTLTLTAGRIDMGTNLLTIARNNTDVFASQGSTSTFINGPLALTWPASGSGILRTFPVGADGIYRPVTISGSPVNAVIRVDVINSAPNVVSKEAALVTISTTRYFRVRLLSGTFSNPATITLFFNLGVEDEIINAPSELIVGRSTNNADWFSIGGSGSFTAKRNPTPTIKPAPEGSVSSGTSASIASDTYYAVASSTSNNPLPVELADFSISENRNQVLLRWNTLTEVDHYAFFLERKWVPSTGVQVLQPSDTTWQTRYTTYGNGASYVEKKYEFVDETANRAGLYLYRLKQQDYNGVYTIYGPWEHTVARPLTSELQPNFPNPFNPETIVPVVLAENAQVLIELFDMNGRRVLTLANQYLPAGRYRFNLNASKLASGIYILRMQSGAQVQSRKITLLK